MKKMEKRGKAVWNFQVPVKLDEAIEKIVASDFHLTKAEYIREAVREKLERAGRKSSARNRKIVIIRANNYFMGIKIIYAPYLSALKLQEKEAERCSFPLRLDVYGSGCDHDCRYCYARAQMIVGGWNNSKNVKHPVPRVADLQCLRKMLLELPTQKPECVSGSGRKWKQIGSLLAQRLCHREERHNALQKTKTVLKSMLTNAGICV
jgi:Arc/MetJ-type ribon-helix-helix transcriptional regulator